MRSADLHHLRRGSGQPLLLIHGLGSSRHSWDPILPRLEADRDVIAVDLPGFGETRAPAGAASIATLADALEAFISRHDLDGVDVVGSSMGARLALELARRRRVGAVVALDRGLLDPAAASRFWSVHRRIGGSGSGPRMPAKPGGASDRVLPRRTASLV